MTRGPQPDWATEAIRRGAIHEPTNDERSARAWQIVRAYVLKFDAGLSPSDPDDRRAMFTDLIADLCHAAQRQGVDVADLLDHAALAYNAERTEPEPERPAIRVEVNWYRDTGTFDSAVVDVASGMPVEGVAVTVADDEGIVYGNNAADPDPEADR